MGKLGLISGIHLRCYKSPERPRRTSSGDFTKLFDYTWKVFFRHYSHWMSNLQPSSSASEGDMWLYALHDKYFPASERLSVIDNVLVVWLPSLDVCNKRRREKKFNLERYQIFPANQLFNTQHHHSRTTSEWRRKKGESRKLRQLFINQIFFSRHVITAQKTHPHDFVVYQSISFVHFWNGFFLLSYLAKHMCTRWMAGWLDGNKHIAETGQSIFFTSGNLHNI